MPAENHHRGSAPRANAPFWYSYDYGSVHFTVISTEHSLERGSPQYRVRYHVAVLPQLGVLLSTTVPTHREGHNTKGCC